MGILLAGPVWMRQGPVIAVVTAAPRRLWAASAVAATLASALVIAVLAAVFR